MAVTIGAAELRDRLASGERLILADERPEAEWRRATIPGAIGLNVYDYFIPRSDRAGVGAMAGAAAGAFAATGIDGSVPVVHFEQATGMISPRGLWFQDFLGLPGGLILDGGIDAWIASGGPTQPGTGPALAVTAATALPEPPAPRLDLVATIDEVAGLDPGRTTLLDVRRRSEHDGSFAHPCCARPGRIPHSAFLFWEDLLEGGRYRPAAEIAALAAAAGLSPDRKVITYCHRGARAATALYALRLAGYRDVAVFVGSWHEWAARADLDIEKG
ncbi:rhodanese-like domain-containing protein [Inquilinus limosus]|uniref:rhodanese-like domain-containing protein n=1 Tax=Inquilinus limosus TaxID=171674 RepID=UPI000B48FCCF|nr:rhodanese-like domain-containing protein [Inquilinus limosus]